MVELGSSNRVRVINLRTNRVYTIACVSLSGTTSDMGANAQLLNSTSLAIDGKNLFLTKEHRIRRMSNIGLNARYP
ncbi:MAG: hypothetical protein MH321_18105 [Leptospiraceae bacterium]|nr:hypothetical protein [Leptospiraceae bacterium]